MILYTIGFTKKTAKQFFEILKKNEVSRIIDIRLNNTSQLAGFAKAKDLEYFLKVITDIEYIYLPELAPTKQILNNYKKKIISWEEYEKEYIALLEDRDILNNLDFSMLNKSCLLCSEPTATYCHRRLLAEYIARYFDNVKIIHL